MDLVRASNAGNRQKPPGPEGWIENGLAAALWLAFSPIAGMRARHALPAARFESNKCLA